nr:toll/interleukin-1 receptor domain-containing protein [bacterium]
MGSCRCKMCGGHIHYADDVSVATCEFCGTEQTIVRTDDLKQLNLFNRANSLRLQNEFDKAQTTYENILIDDPNNAEAHWGICLCRYGIEYVDDKKTNKKVPTCHRTVFNFIYDDLDYIEALNNCDVVAKKQYEKEAKVIDKIQKNILAISQKEAPYDIFICYKENDDNGNRTKDSVIAQEIYDELIKKGYKVFFSRITLESKIGSEYEPIIFAALMSSKVMLAIGSKPEHYNSPWVKNEWARFLSFMKDQQGKYLIPCYFDMEAYDMPEEFLMLQALDIGKLGYMQDLTRGIDKLFGGKKNNVNYSSLSTPEKAIQNLVERIEISLEDADYSSASGFVEEILDIDAKRPEAYLYAILIERKVKSVEALKYIDNPLDDDKNYNKALRFADGEYKEFLIELNNTIKANIEERKNMNAYNNALEYLKKGNYILALNSLVKITEYKDSKELKEKCQKECYSLGIKRKNDGSYGEAVEFFTAANDYQDSLNQKEQCQKLKEEQQAKSLIRMHIRVLNEIIDKVEKTELFAITDKNMYNESLLKLKTMDPEYMPKDKVNYYISKKEELIEIDDARRKRLEEKNIKKKKLDKVLAIIVAVVGLAIFILIIVLFSKYFSGSNRVTQSTDKTNVNPKTTENLKNHVPIRINVESLTDNYTNYFVDFEIDGAKFDSETRKYDYVEKGTSTWIHINIPSDVKFLGLYNGDTLLTEYDSYHITANEEMNLSLKYCRAKSTVKITKNILNAGTVTEDRECEYGTLAEINASQNLGYFFAGWYIGDELISTRERYFVQVLENDLKITAKYQKEPYM